MITRTYPSEAFLIDADTDIISGIRDLIGDRIEITRYYLPSGNISMSKYVMPDNLTFFEGTKRIWPYQLKLGSTVCSGSLNPQIVDYHYMAFYDPYQDITASGIDFWCETFYLSDYEIWTAYLSVDLTALVRKEECITPEMEMLKAAIDLVPALRTAKRDNFYGSYEVVDDDTTYKKSSGLKDPWKDLLDKLNKDLQDLLDACNKRPFFGGIRVE